jgi:hypothetical protein
VNSLNPTKLLLVIACLVIITAYTIPSTAFSSAQEELEWYAEPMHTVLNAETLAFSGYTPNNIKNAYNLPDYGGNGTTIAIIIAYHTPNIKNYLTVFSEAYDLPLPTDSNFIVYKMWPTIEVKTDWSLEACLDVEWAHAIAPNATILLVEARSNSGSDLLAAIAYATSQPDVVAVSMSWGTQEFITESNYNSLFDFSNIGFFAASGDNGSEVMWPSCSSNVVAVGGTTLNLDSDGNVVSETAWLDSGGGISVYETIPTYQSNYGLNETKRIVPDVSYNAAPSTGVRVYYNSAWHILGGTSAGAPQWAAIYALGLSATHENLYQRAESAYSSYFRDITSGSTSKYSASIGYDYVTGLGSPLTSNFKLGLEVSPLAGGAGTNITLNVSGLLGTAANISYLDPINSTWISVDTNVIVTSGNLTYTTGAPDLLQSNPSGDNTESYDLIVYKVTDNSGESYNTTVPFSLYRRGLTSVGNSTAEGIYGNNTVFGPALSIQNGDTLTVSGEWFRPGNATLYWDTIEAGNLTVAQNGTFTAAVTLPTSSSGIHTLTIQDNFTRFFVNVTVSPLVSTDYSEGWQTSDFPIALAADAAVDEIYYRIKGGEIQNITNGYPYITTQDANNTLEYWCNWTYNGASFETRHETLTEIKLDKTAPTGSIITNSPTTSRNITLYLSAVDSVSGVSDIRFSNDGTVWSSWETYYPTKTWTLPGSDGLKHVRVQFRNGAGLASETEVCQVTLQTSDPTTSPQSTSSTTATPKATATSTPTENPTATPVPELSTGAVIGVFVIASLLLVFFAKKRALNKPYVLEPVCNATHN